MFLSLNEVGLEIALAVAFAIVAGLSDDDFVVGLIILAVDASGAIETNKVVVPGSSLDLDDDGLVRRIQVIGDADHFDGIVWSDLRVDKQLPRTDTHSSIPSELPVLGRIETHLSNLVGVERVAHHPCVVCISLTVCVIGKKWNAKLQMR